MFVTNQTARRDSPEDGSLSCLVCGPRQLMPEPSSNLIHVVFVLNDVTLCPTASGSQRGSVRDRKSLLRPRTTVSAVAHCECSRVVTRWTQEYKQWYHRPIAVPYMCPNIPTRIRLYRPQIRRGAMSLPVSVTACLPEKNCQGFPPFNIKFTAVSFCGYTLKHSQMHTRLETYTSIYSMFHDIFLYTGCSTTTSTY